MAFDSDEKTTRPSRWSSLFGKGKVKRATVQVNDVITSKGQREALTTGTGQADDKTVTREPKSAATKDVAGVTWAGAADNQEAEGSRAVSVRRASDSEIQGASDEAGDDNVDEHQEEVDRIEFYRRDQPNFWLSNSSEHAVYLDGVRYPTAEHLFQALKFLPHRIDIATKIRKISSPTEAIKEARRNQVDIQKGWIGQGGNVASMREVLLLKFTQHSALRRQLLLTGDAELVEASPSDAFWGSAAGIGGGFGVGRNELGKALARTRETIRGQAGLGIGSGAKTV